MVAAHVMQGMAGGTWQKPGVNSQESISGVPVSNERRKLGFGSSGLVFSRSITSVAFQQGSGWYSTLRGVVQPRSASFHRWGKIELNLSAAMAAQMLDSNLI